MRHAFRRTLHSAVLALVTVVALSMPAGAALVAMDASPDLGMASNGLMGDYEDKGLG